MATPAQITANRANAQKSTGPRSAEGKSASRFNALKHGIDAASLVIPGEDPAEYDALAAEYSGEFRPQSPSEFFHVETMLRADWQKIRLQRVEADLFRTLLAESPGATLAAALLSDSPAAKLLARTQRQIAAFERTWYRAHTELHRARRQESRPGARYRAPGVGTRGGVRRSGGEGARSRASAGAHAANDVPAAAVHHAAGARISGGRSTSAGERSEERRPG